MPDHARKDPTPTPGIDRPTRSGGAPLHLRAGALIASLALLGACADTQTNQRSMAEEGRAVFAPVGAETRNVDTTAAWSIVLVAYRGERQNANAAQDLTLVRNEGGIAGAYLEDRGDATVIAYGKYDDPESSQAQSDLQRIQQIEVNGGRPFAGAMLTPPSAANLGSAPQYDLRNVKRRLGEWAIYTLQVGAYGRIDQRPTADELAQFRAAAEEAVIQLRREGEQAFYYHGPTMSLVLIGAWGERDFEPAKDPRMPPTYEAPAIRRTREKFPHNLFNGAAVREKGPDGQQRLQPSTLVGIPNG